MTARRLRCRGSRCAVLFLVCVLVVAPAHAQDRVTVFLHGFNGHAVDWSAQADQLRQRVSIDPRLPEFDWRQRFSTQLSQVRADWSWLPSDTVAVGHSNGGLLARSWSRERHFDGIVTIGTPHRGAPLVPHFVQWAGFHSDTSALLNEVLSAFSAGNEWDWIYWFVEGAIHWTSDFSIWSVVDLAATIGFDGYMPVADDMVPGSAFLSDLNSWNNLGRESNDIPGRVGIVSIAHNFYWAGPARAIAPEYADDVAAVLYGAAYGLLYWSGYLFTQAAPTDVAATRQSMSLMGVAGKLLAIDPLYCRMVSRYDMSDCLANDGVVPDESQEFPGAANFRIGLDNDGPAHIQERDRSGDALYDALVWYVHVPPRSAAPPAFGGDGGGSPPPGQGTGGNPPASSGPGVAISGRELHAGETIDSASGQYHLSYQGDGNLVLYDENWSPMWASNTVGIEPNVAAMQGDGNFVIYDPAWTPVWASGDSWGHPGAYLVVQNDGNLVIYDPNGTPLWATGTVRG